MLRILLVEDHSDCATALVTLLEFWGYASHVAVTASAALNACPDF